MVINMIHKQTLFCTPHLNHDAFGKLIVNNIPLYSELINSWQFDVVTNTLDILADNIYDTLDDFFYNFSMSHP